MKSNSTSRTVLQQEKFSLTITMPIQATLKQYLQGVTETCKVMELACERGFHFDGWNDCFSLESGLNSLMNAVLIRHLCKQTQKF